MPKVQAYVYDISQGMAAMMGPALVGKPVELVPHTGIVVFGKEYFFGSGPVIGEPGKSVGIPAAKVIDLGETGKTMDELETYINSVLALEHNEANYNLCNHNCNHYANDVAKFLLDGKGLPDSIVNFADETLNTPQGQQMKVMIENMEKQMRSNMGGGGSGLNPFANANGSGAPATPSMPMMPGGMPGMPAAAAAPAATAPAAAASAAPNEELEDALKTIASQAVEAKRACLTTLMKMMENVEKNPAEPKFRKIKLSNAAFNKKVVSCSGGVEAMLAMEWTPDQDPDGEDVWILPSTSSQQATFRQRLQAEVAKLPAAPAPAPKAAASPGLGAMPGLGGMPGQQGFGGTGGYGGLGGMPGGLPGGLGGLGGLGRGAGGMPDPAMMQQMMNNPAMMQQAQQMMQSNPQMMAQAQQMMNDPAMMAQVQQMMSDPNMMAQMQNMMGGRGGGFP